VGGRLVGAVAVLDQAVNGDELLLELFLLPGTDGAVVGDAFDQREKVIAESAALLIGAEEVPRKEEAEKEVTG